jgi:hypothetical protein
MPIVDGGSSSGLLTTTTVLPITEEIILDVQKQLQDITGVVYNPAELIPYINLAIVEMVKTDPTIYSVIKVYMLGAGSIQALSSIEIKLLGAICNMTSGVTVSDVVTILSKDKMDQLFKTWQTFATNKVVKYVVYDEMTPDIFYVIPPQPAGTDQGLKMIFSELPAQLTEADSTFPLEESYKLPCINYVLYLVLREETTVPNALNKANMCLGQFFRQMGVATQQTKQNKE